MEERPTLLQLVDVKKKYHLGDVDVPVLHGVSFTVERGDSPTSGEYLLDGRDVSRLSRGQLADVRNRTIGFVFQNFNLLSRTSALENVELPLIYAGVSTKERVARAKQALDHVGLADRLDHHPSQLSGGQQQRVAIARALVSSPKLILADEPTGNLDSRTSMDIMALFQELGRSGITVVLVTDEQDIAGYAKRVVVLKDGLIMSDRRQEPVPAVASAPPAQLEAASP